MGKGFNQVEGQQKGSDQLLQNEDIAQQTNEVAQTESQSAPNSPLAQQQDIAAATKPKSFPVPVRRPAARPAWMAPGGAPKTHALNPTADQGAGVSALASTANALNATSQANTPTPAPEAKAPEAKAPEAKVPSRPPKVPYPPGHFTTAGKPPASDPQTAQPSQDTQSLADTTADTAPKRPQALTPAIDPNTSKVEQAISQLSALGLPEIYLRGLPPADLQRIDQLKLAFSTGNVARADQIVTELQASIGGTVNLLRSILVRPYVDKVNAKLAQTLGGAAKSTAKSRFTAGKAVEKHAQVKYNRMQQVMSVDQQQLMMSLNTDVKDNKITEEEKEKKITANNKELMEAKFFHEKFADFKKTAIEKGVHPDFKMLTIEEVMSIVGYTSEMYRILNPIMRNAGAGQALDDENAAWAQTLTSALAKMPPYAAPTFRHNGWFSGYKELTQPGAKSVDMAFLSTAVSQQSCASAAENHDILEIVKGQSGRLIANGSIFSGEAEVLYPAGVPFTITKVATRDPQTKEWSSKDPELMFYLNQDSKKDAIQMIVVKVEGSASAEKTASKDGSDGAADLNAQIDMEAKFEASRVTKQASQAEAATTKKLQELADNNKAKLVGLEYRLKTEESLARKLVERATTGVTQKKLTPWEAVKQQADRVNDVLRYTMVLKPSKYWSAHDEIITALGPEADLPRDGWNPIKGQENMYKGKNMTFKVGQQLFELQLHTDQSFETKQNTHTVYEELRTTTDPERKKQLQAQIQQEFSKVKTPKGHATVGIGSTPKKR